MSTTRSYYAWLAICLASIFFCLKIDATPVAAVAKPSSLTSSQPADAFKTFNIDEAKELVSVPKNIVARSADADDNSVDGEDEENKDTKTEKPNSDNSEEIFPSGHKPHHHAHGSHGALGPVKHLLNTVRDHGTAGGVLGGLGNILGAMQNHANGDHESPIETEKDRETINSSTGLHVLEFLGTLFGLLWGFLSNIPALFGSSSSGASGGQ